jgi:ribonuclease HI
MSAARAFVLLSGKRLTRGGGGWKRPAGMTPPVHSFSTQQSPPAQRNQHVPLLTKTDVRKMRVAELRELLKSRGMDATGLKQVLVERLISARDAPIRNQSKRTSTGKSEPPPPPLRMDEDSSAMMKSPPIFDSTRTHMLRFAGYSNKHTGETGLGLLLYDVETQTEVWCARRYYRFDGHNGNRFEVEFQGLTACLNFLHAHGVNKIILATDSDVMFKQLTGIYHIKKCHRVQSAYWRTILAKEQFATAHLSLSSTAENAKTLVLARRAVATKQSFGLDEDKDEEPWEQSNVPTSSLDSGTLLVAPIDPSRKYLLRFDGGSRGNPVRA